jgi:hypothetical protein
MSIEEPDWGSPYVRPTDPGTSHEAAEELDPESAAFEAWGYFQWFAREAEDGLTASEFEQCVEKRLMGQGWERERAHRKAESMRRRLQPDLEKVYKLVELRYFYLPQKDGTFLRVKRKRARQQIYYIRPPGIEVEGF